MRLIKDALLAILSRVRDNVPSVHDVGIVFHKMISCIPTLKFWDGYDSSRCAVSKSLIYQDDRSEEYHW